MNSRIRSRLPGRVALWRTVAASGLTEEISAPFDTTARFRFFVLNADTSVTSPPAQLADLRGLDLVLDGQSEKTPQAASAPKKAKLTTAVFFKNRLN